MAKQDRIVLRIDETIKAQFVEAAEAFGMNLSTFMVAAAQEQLMRAQWRTRVILLSDRDRDQDLAAQDRPARLAPETVNKAKARYAALVVRDR